MKVIVNRKIKVREQIPEIMMQGHNQANTIPADNCREDKFDPDLDDCKGSRYVNQIIKD
jgi:hypothetical protein